MTEEMKETTERDPGAVAEPEAADVTETKASEEDGASDSPASKKEKKAAAAELKKLRADNTLLAEKLLEAQKNAEEQKDKYLRTLAEYDNYRKRTAKEREGIYADATADAVTNLLPLLDNLERASHFADGAQAAEGVRMILASVPDILGKMNITAFGAPGETFDPNIHNAVMHIDDEQYGEGEIVEVFQCGYRHGDKIIRYAMVKTAN